MEMFWHNEMKTTRSHNEGASWMLSIILNLDENQTKEKKIRMDLQTDNQFR